MSGLLAIAGVPLLIAVVLWALTDLSTFVVYGLLAAMVFPASLVQPGGTNIAAADILLLLVLAIWLIRNAVGTAPNPWVRGNRILIPAVLFVLLSLLSAVWSNDSRSTLLFALQISEITIVFPLVFSTLPASLAQIRRGLFIMVWISTALAVFAIITYAKNPNDAVSGTYLPGFNKNALGSVVAAGLMLAYALWSGCSDARTRLFLLGSMAVGVGGLVASGSRGSMLGAAVGALCIGLLVGNRRVTAVFLAVTLAAVYLAVLAPAQAQKTTDGGYSSSVLRPRAWAGAIKKIEHQPWIGTGAATYSDTLSYPPGFVTNDPMNLFLLTWAELGIPGLLVLCFLLYRMGAVIVQARTLERDAAVLLAAVGGMAVAFFIHFQVDVSWVRGETTLEFGGVGLAQAIVRLSADRRSPVAGDAEASVPLPPAASMATTPASV